MSHDVILSRSVAQAKDPCAPTRTLALVLSLALAVPLSAQRPNPLAAPYTEAMTWTDIRAAIDGGKKVIIIPTGGVEQNGPHMTLGKHNDIVTFAAGLLAKRLNGLVAPTIKWVPEGNNPDVVQRQPGTITNPEAPYESLLDAAARSERVHGFTDILLIGDSGGNQRGLTAVADSLNKEWAGSGVTVYALTDYYSKGHADIYAWLEKDYGWNRQTVGSHAGIMDTSQLLYVNPAAVRRANVLPSGGGRGSGVNGDPTKATPELGKRMIDTKVAAAVAQYTALKSK
jgi:creatinine amidohydrolase/Fe(II)-dependent formamide hydrolase-like protein